MDPPNVQNGQQLQGTQQLAQQRTQFQAQFQAIQQQLAQRNVQFQAIQQQLHAIQQQLQQMSTTMATITTYIQQGPMRAYNASASLDAPLRGPAGQIDPPLPNTPRLISLATEADLNALNAHVGPLPMYNNNATVDVRRQLLADFLGIVV